MMLCVNPYPVLAVLRAGIILGSASLRPGTNWLGLPVSFIAGLVPELQNTPTGGALAAGIADLEGSC